MLMPPLHTSTKPASLQVGPEQAAGQWVCRGRRHFPRTVWTPGMLSLEEARGEARLHPYSRASGPKISAKCLTRYQPWALEGWAALFSADHWVRSSRLSTHPLWVPPPAPRPGQPACAHESPGPSEGVGGSAKQNTETPSSH